MEPIVSFHISFMRQIKNHHYFEISSNVKSLTFFKYQRICMQMQIVKLYEFEFEYRSDELYDPKLVNQISCFYRLPILILYP
jgi:hypothetical protein